MVRMVVVGVGVVVEVVAAVVVEVEVVAAVVVEVEVVAVALVAVALVLTTMSLPSRESPPHLHTNKQMEGSNGIHSPSLV